MFHKFVQNTSLLQTTELIFLGDLEKLMRIKQSLEIVTFLRKEVVEKNSEHLNGRKQISSVLLV